MPFVTVGLPLTLAENRPVSAILTTKFRQTLDRRIHRQDWGFVHHLLRIPHDSESQIGISRFDPVVIPERNACEEGGCATPRHDGLSCRR